MFLTGFFTEFNLSPRESFRHKVNSNFGYSSISIYVCMYVYVYKYIFILLGYLCDKGRVSQQKNIFIFMFGFLVLLIISRLPSVPHRRSTSNWFRVKKKRIF